MRAFLALSDYKKTTAAMLAESEKLGLAKVAKEYKQISQDWERVGNRSKEGEVAKLKAFITETEERISTMQSLTKADSKLNKRLELIIVIRKIILEYAAKRRDSLAKPLEEGFAEGFKLLSRKSEAVKGMYKFQQTITYHLSRWTAMMVIGWTEIYLQQKSSTSDYQCYMQLASCLESHCRSLLILLFQGWIKSTKAGL